SNGKTSITLHPILAKNLRAHQVEGLQFLWKEIAVFVPPCSGGGALLAHTMGLGKTVTVIAFLFMLGEVQGRRPYETANSSLPYHFKMGAHPSRVLILVPGGLLQNWLLELQTWAAKFPSVEGVSSPGKTLIDSVYTMFGINDLDTRIEVIKEWYENGGILLLGHGMFRALVKPKTSSHRDPGQRDDINNYLLYPGPEIVIADEAHAFKTHRSKLTEAVQLIQTRSKIALTASPLSNNLFEFWSLIRWVWQDCRIALTFKMFRKTYVTPIAVGFNRVDDEVSKTSIAARKLKEIIEATAKKIHRKNISTIKELLKPKTEFILRVSLTKDQVELYNDFLEDSSGLKESSIWRHFCLRAVCNHPEIFRINLEETGTRVSDVIKDAPEVSTANSGSTTQPRTLLASSSKSSNTLKEAKAIALRRANEAIEQSSKFKLLFALVSEFKAIGDRVLLFSHSIDTLSYLYNLARLLGFTVLRLDGSVPFPQRQTDLASFNGGTFDIYLVSTKAGGVGLNLQCANRVIILDNDHSPLWEQQAIGRSYRLGQTKEVFVYRFLVEKTLETRVAREKYRKVRLADIVVDGNWVKRRGYARHGDHRTVWEKAHYTEAPSEVVKDGWCGRDQVLDKVVDSLGIVTEVILDEDETTFTG
ncbi:P-loop containing nucleoside triphosphate hydrolase protein, partial [Peziza echinospora]